MHKEKLFELDGMCTSFWGVYTMSLILFSKGVGNPIFGLIQSGQCIANSYHYSVHDYPTNSTVPHLSLYSLTNPIVYDGVGHCCIDDEHLQSCNALRTDPMFQLSAELFTRHFQPGFPIPYFVYMLIPGFLHFLGVVHATDIDRKHSPEERHYWSYFASVTSFAHALLMLLSAYHFHAVFTENCDSSVVNKSEATDFCDMLSSCGLALASVYPFTWTGESYAPIMIGLGLVMLGTNIFRLPLMLLNDLHDKLMGPFEVSRLAILDLQGDELSLALALEAASTEFIDYYLNDWHHVQLPDHIQPVPAANNYGVLDTNHYSSHCCRCKDHLLAYTMHGMRAKVMQIECGRRCHQICILRWAIDTTYTESACSFCTDDTYILK